MLGLLIDEANEARLAVIAGGPQQWGALKLSFVELGTISLPTGRIVACDPLVRHDLFPFTLRVPQGEAMALVAEVEPGDHVCALLRFSEAEIARWELARTRPASVGDADRSEGYSVDAGTGCFVDEAYADRLEARAVMDRIQASRRGVVELGAAPATAAFFASGAGDGIYSSYFGRDASGEVVALVTEFLLEQVDPLVWGGPWSPGGAEGGSQGPSLGSLLGFVRRQGAPRDAWTRASLDGARWNALWEDASAYELVMVIRVAGHPKATEILEACLGRVRAIADACDEHGLDDAIAALDPRAATASTFDDLRRLNIELAHRIRKRERAEPVAPTGNVLAFPGRSLRSQSRFREVERTTSEALAGRIRELAPAPPPWPTLLAALTNTDG